MRYRRLGRTGLDVSEIGLGALEIGRDWGVRVEGDFGRPTEQDAIRLVHAALDLGINFIDTAPAYQLSEERLGKALAGRHDHVVLATKVGEHYDDKNGFWYDYSPAAVRASVELSLRRLRVDAVDLLQIHSASVEIIERGEVLAEMQRLRDAGYVRFLGMSGDDDAAVAAIDDGGYDTVQIPYNILDQSAARSVFPLSRERDIGTIIMAPLRHGTITDKYEHLADEDRADYEKARRLEDLLQPDQSLSDAALRFVLACEAVSTVIAGTRKIEHLRANVEAASTPLPPDHVRRIEELFERNFDVDPPATSRA